MTLRRFWIPSLAIVATFGAVARAEDAKPAEPTIVIRLKSFDGLVGDAKYIAELAGKAEEAKQIDGILQNLPVKNGLAGTGLDTKRPFLFYGIVTPDAISSYGALLIPLADDKAFMSFLNDTLGNFGVAVTKGGDGIHSVAIPGSPVDAYFTVANGYAYITAKDKSTLAAGNRFTPEKLLAANDNAVASAVVRIDQIPDMLKQMALQQLDVQAAEAKDRKQPGETPAQSTLRLAAIDYVFKQIRHIVRDGGTLDARLDVDRSKEDIGFGLNFTGKPGSSLAKDIASLAERTSLFASTLDGAMNIGLNLAVPEELREIGMSVIKEGFDQGLKNEKDEKKRALAQKAFETLSPIIKAGLVDVGFGVRGPNSSGHYTFAFGMKVPDGKAIERFVKDEIVPIIPADKRQSFSPDAETIAGLKVHKITPPSGEAVSPSDKKIYGDSPFALIAFASNRVVGALGADPAATLKSALESKGSRSAAPLSLTMSIAKMAPLMDQNRAEAANKVALKTFADAPRGSDLFSVKVEGGPALKVRVNLKALGITFFSKMHEFDR